MSSILAHSVVVVMNLMDNVGLLLGLLVMKSASAKMVGSDFTAKLPIAMLSPLAMIAVRWPNAVGVVPPADV